MFEEISEILKQRISCSLAIVPNEKQASACSADSVVIGSHPIPDEQSMQAGEKTVAFLQSIPSNALLINLISGGTSSLLCSPAKTIEINNLANTFELLVNSGATIQEINIVRKHCSRIKGGQLLRYLHSDITVIDLVISDVPGNALSVIGSGPTIPDFSTYKDAKRILIKYNLWNRIPDSVQNHIKLGVEGEVPETLQEGEYPSNLHQSVIIGSASILARKISQTASKQGFNVTVADRPFTGDVEEVASNTAEQVLSVAPKRQENRTGSSDLFVFWGESTVQVTGDGKGGRNQELALRGAKKIAGYDNITWLSAGTDGIDGPTDAAGAIVDGNTLDRALQQGCNPDSYLQNNDSYYFHEKMGTLFKTGPTGNNLMDLTLVVVK